MLLALFMGGKLSLVRSRWHVKAPALPKPTAVCAISVDPWHLLEKKPGQIKFNQFDKITKIHFTNLIWRLNDELYFKM